MVKGTIRRSGIDALLTGEYSLNDIGSRTPPIIKNKKGKPNTVTGHWIRQYVANTGQHSSFMEKRREYRRLHTKRNLRKRMIAALKRHVIQRAGEESWAVQKVVDYYLNVRVQLLCIPIQELVDFFEIYKNAQDSGTKLPLRELAAQSGIGCVSTASKILKSSGLEPLYGSWKNKFHRMPIEKKQTIKRAYDTDLPLADIAFFLGLQPFNVEYNMQSICGGTGTRKRCIGQFLAGDGNSYFAYRHASQIYEAQDLGFNEGEIAYLFDMYPRAVQYAVQHREQIGQEIITALDVLYPDVKHERPYLNSASVMRI